MSFFHPPFLGCPVCNTDPKRNSAYRFSAHKHLDGDRYRGHKCGHEFSLYEALKNQCHGTFGILGTFSHWDWSSEVTIVVGRIEEIPLTVPEGITPFSVFLTQYTPVDGPQIGYLPKTLDIDDNRLLITTTATTNTRAEDIGTAMRLMVKVYGHRIGYDAGWTRLLYEALTDFSEHRYSLSVFKLATAAEIYCDSTFEKYLSLKTVPHKLSERLLKSARYWEMRFGRILDILPEYLTEAEVEEFLACRQPFKESVRRIRNEFAHDNPAPANHKDAASSFKNAFPLFWTIGRLNERLVTT